MKKITDEELKEILNNHEKWIDSEELGGERADLSHTDLSGKNLTKVYLARANLSNVVLSNANLTRCTLRRANLSHANLSDADLSKSDLSNADLSVANLKGVNLSDADCRYANLSGADLSDVNLTGIKLAGANLTGAITDKKYLTVSGIGSRKGNTIYCVEDTLVLCGCWNDYRGGTIEEFEARVENIYGIKGETPNKQYYDEYTNAINFFKSFR